MGVQRFLSVSAISAFTGVALSACSSSLPVYYVDDFNPPIPPEPIYDGYNYSEPAYQLPQQTAPTSTSRYVGYYGNEAPGTILVNLQERKLYYVAGNSSAIEYPVAVGRDGAMGIGNNYTITREADWPNWYPTQSMRDKDPSLPQVVKGGPGNPLGAAALYLGNSMFRIHGNNNPSSIGTAASSGCIRMYNHDIQDLKNRVGIGTPVRINTTNGFTPGIQVSSFQTKTSFAVRMPA